jgi:hypothetical protein
VDLLARITSQAATLRSPRCSFLLQGYSHACHVSNPFERFCLCLSHCDIYVGPEDGGVVAILISRKWRIDEMVVWVFRSIVLCNYQSNAKEQAKSTKPSEHDCRLGLTGQKNTNWSREGERRQAWGVNQLKRQKTRPDPYGPGVQVPSTFPQWLSHDTLHQKLFASWALEFSKPILSNTSDC